MVQRYEQTRKLQWYKRGAAYKDREYSVREIMSLLKVGDYDHATDAVGHDVNS